MFVALLATWITLPAADERAHRTPIRVPLKALRHRGLLTVGVTALLYNVGFFTLLAFTPFPLDLSAHGTGLVFFGWGLLLALSSVFIAPWVQRHVGTFAGIVGALLGFALVLAVMAVWTEDERVLAVGVVVAGGLLGIINALIPETVMTVALSERVVASSAYSVVRFSGGAVAPWLAGRLGEQSVHIPFRVGVGVGAGAVVAALALLGSGRALVRATDAQPEHGAEPFASETEAEALTVGTA